MRILPARYTRGSMRAYRWLVLAIVSPLLGCDASNPAAPALPEVSEPTDAFVIIITPDVAEVAPGGTVGLSVNITDAESGDPPVDGTSVTITTSAGQLEATNTDPGPLVLVPTIGGVASATLNAVGLADGDSAEIRATLEDTSTSVSIPVVGDAGGGGGAAPPAAAFTFESDELLVLFSDASTGEPTSWQWDFGDLSCLPLPDCNQSSEQNPLHQYSAVDTYVVTLTAANVLGTNTIRQFVGVGTPVEPLEAAFEADPGDGTGLQVLFTDTTTGDPTGWLWDFSDGSTSVEQDPIHDYLVGGSYAVTLEVSRGATTSSTSQFVTVGTEIPDIMADFEFVTTSGSLVVTFTDLSVGVISERLWDFGNDFCTPQPDCTTSTMANPVYEFDFTGEYVTVLTVTDPTGATETKAQSVSVDSGEVAPIAEFSFEELDGNVVRFTDESTNNPTRWTWDFGDGGSDTIANPVHSYAQGGRYTVTLTVANGGGQASRTEQINLDPLVAEFSFQQNGLEAIFTDLSTGDPTEWSWDFGDNVCMPQPDCTESTEQNPSHTYPDTGPYTVTLVVKDGQGEDSITKTITIFPFEARPLGRVPSASSERPGRAAAPVLVGRSAKGSQGRPPHRR